MSVKKIISVLLLFMAVAVCVNAETDAADYQTNQPFGWATCSNVNGKEYVVDGGNRIANPNTIVLYSSGGDDRNKILNAIKQNDIIILDGSKGDFIVSKSMGIEGL